MISFWHDYDVLNPFKRFSWYDFTLICIRGEYDARFGNIELYVALLGLHVRLVVKVSAGDVEFQEHLQEMVDKWMDKK